MYRLSGNSTKSPTAALDLIQVAKGKALPTLTTRGVHSPLFKKYTFFHQERLMCFSLHSVCKLIMNF